MKQEIKVVAALIVLIAMASNLSYEDEVMEAQNYTDMVCSGVYPDFKHINPECPKLGPAMPERY